MCVVFVFLFKQKTAYEMRISDWSSDVCSSDLSDRDVRGAGVGDPGGNLAAGGHRLAESDRHPAFGVRPRALGERFAVDRDRRDGQVAIEIEDRKSTRLNSSH